MHRFLLFVTLLIPLAPDSRADEKADARGTYRSYSLTTVQPTEARRMLAELLGENAVGVRLFADNETGTLLVSGSADVHALARQFVDEVNATPVPEAKPPVLRTYHCQASQIDAMTAALKQQLGSNAKISADRQRGLLFVLAPENSQDIANRVVNSVPSGAAGDLPARRQTLQQADDSVPPRQTTLFAQGESTVGSAAGLLREGRSHTFRNITNDQCRRALQKLLGQRMQSSNDNTTVEIVFRNHSSVTLRFVEPATCAIDGPSDVAAQCAVLLQELDSALEQKPGETVRFLPLSGVDPAVLNRAIGLWKGSAPKSELLPDNAQGALSPPNSIYSVGFVQETPATPDESATQVSDDEQLRRPLSDVDIQPLEDLDVMILRGRDPDVQELIRIIREIERLSADTQPEIELYHLQHVKGESLDTLIDTVLEDLTGPLQGQISITPLVKPNALLLIGWGEAVNAAKKLIAELDQPVSPHTQMKTFALKHAPAEDVAETIQEFLNERGGLGPDVNVTANSRTNSLIVSGSPRDLLEVARLVRELDTHTSESFNQAHIVRLKNSLAADVSATITEAISAARGGVTGRNAGLEMLMQGPDGRNILSSGLLDGVNLTADSRTNQIVITGPKESIPLVRRLIETFDETPAASAQIKVFEIRNGDANGMVTVLRSLFPVSTTGSTVPQLPTAESETSLVPVRFSVDARTNTIIATGTAGDLRIVEALIMRLDETDSQDRINQVYKLQHTPALDVAQAISDFLRSERIVAQAAPGQENPFEQIESEVVVVPEPVGNALIISATPRYFDAILELVEDLDEQPPQVMIQVILAEIEHDNVHEFGIELGLQDSLLFDRSLLGDLLTTTSSSALSTSEGVVTTTQELIQAASLTPGFDFNNNPLGNSGSTNSLSTAGNVGGQGLSHINVGRLNSQLGYGGLVLSASSENISVLLRALNQSKSIEILSRPQIMTLNNQQAFIQVGQQVPRIVSAQQNQFGQQQSIVELQRVGLILGVTPRISPDGMVVMEVDAEKSSLAPEEEGIPISVTEAGQVLRSPRVNIATAQTTVSAASGQTVVIGGLITNDVATMTRKVPWLGDLPALGRLFRYDGNSHRKRELLIILTPHVIRGEAEAEYLKQVEMARMSWVSSDVFDWLDSGAVCPPGQLDGSGTQTIYPDQTPGVEWFHQSSDTQSLVPPSPVGEVGNTGVEAIPTLELDAPEETDEGVRKASFRQRLRPPWSK